MPVHISQMKGVVADCSKVTNSPGTASFCCFTACRAMKTNTFHVLLLLEAQASAVFLCSLKQRLLIAQLLKLMLFVRGRSEFI